MSDSGASFGLVPQQFDAECHFTRQHLRRRIKPVAVLKRQAEASQLRIVLPNVTVYHRMREAVGL